MTFWLVLIALNGSGSNSTPALMHVGNYSSVADCDKAAKATTNAPVGPITALPSLGPTIGVWFMCVQASESGTTPPN